MDNKINLIIDFDSTFIKLETIEVLADFALENKKDKKNIKPYKKNNQSSDARRNTIFRCPI